MQGDREQGVSEQGANAFTKVLLLPWQCCAAAVGGCLYGTAAQHRRVCLGHV